RDRHQIGWGIVWFVCNSQTASLACFALQIALPNQLIDQGMGTWCGHSKCVGKFLGSGRKSTVCNDVPYRDERASLRVGENFDRRSTARSRPVVHRNGLLGKRSKTSIRPIYG